MASASFNKEGTVVTVILESVNPRHLHYWNTLTMPIGEVGPWQTTRYGTRKTSRKLVKVHSELNIRFVMWEYQP